MEDDEVLISVAAGQEILDVPGRADRKRIVSRIRGLASEPRPPGSRPLAGDDRLRVRQGDTRIISVIRDDERRVVVVNIGHLRDVYR